ncbi:hypothetical protein QBC44DRAFT_101898 [Cladorrhinum sp. PSN332]|nr:hypothetical protein QBC44DRAFT_101898 [Cladorrhinum sp. PSN332]
MAVTKKESILWRAVLALPLLGLAVTAFHVMDVRPVLKAAKAMRDGGKLVLGGANGGAEVNVVRKFYGFEGFDDFVAEVNMFFVPGMYGLSPQCRRQMLTFITEGTNLLLIWTFESARRANNNGFNILQFPNLFTLIGQLLGIGVLSPLWCFLQYVFSPMEKYAARDQRLTRTRWSFASLPAILVAFLLPFYGFILSPDLETRQHLLFIWQLYPVYLSVTLFILSRFFKDNSNDSLTNTEKDLPVVKFYIGASSLLGAAWWISNTWLGAGIIENFIPTDIPPRAFNAGTLTFQDFLVQFMRWDGVFAFGSHLLWMAYQFWDLKTAGMLEEGWLRVVGLMLAGVPVVGPGASLGMAWLFRENILATRTRNRVVHKKTA